MNSLNRTFGTGRTRRATRVIAAAALSAAVLVSASGCALISTQATTISYSPSDGILVPESGPIEVRNVLIVANEEGTEGNLIAAFVNATDETHTVSMEFGEAGSGVTEELRVPANTVISLGVDGNEPILLEGLELLPGSDVPASFQSGDGETALVNVPVLDGAQDYLEQYVP